MRAEMTCVGKREFLGDEFFENPNNTVSVKEVHLVEVHFLTEPAGDENAPNDKLVMTMGPEQAARYILGNEYIVHIVDFPEVP